MYPKGCPILMFVLIKDWGMLLQNVQNFHQQAISRSKMLSWNLRYAEGR